MRSALKTLLKPVMSARLLRWARLTFGWQWLRGDHASWADARRQSAGYDNPDELGRYAAAARAVERGGAAWERDGHTFADPAVHAPLLSALRAAAARHGGLLDVVDFGGALGSTWRQHRAALSDLKSVRWRVVEQAPWVALGQREFANNTLTFHATLAEAAADPARQVLLLSSVLPYIEDPRAVLNEALAFQFDSIIIDRTPFWKGSRDRVTVQHTPPEFGGGTYPCRVFAREPLLAPMAGDYELASEWPGFDDLAAWAQYRGFHFVRRA